MPIREHLKTPPAPGETTRFTAEEYQQILEFQKGGAQTETPQVITPEMVEQANQTRKPLTPEAKQAIEKMKRQAQEPAPPLPPELEAQINAPPPPLPDDLRRALATPPRIVTTEEVNGDAPIPIPAEGLPIVVDPPVIEEATDPMIDAIQ